MSHMTSKPALLNVTHMTEAKRNATLIKPLSSTQRMKAITCDSSRSSGNKLLAVAYFTLLSMDHIRYANKTCKPVSANPYDATRL